MHCNLQNAKGQFARCMLLDMRGPESWVFGGFDLLAQLLRYFTNQDYLKLSKYLKDQQIRSILNEGDDTSSRQGNPR